MENNLIIITPQQQEQLLKLLKIWLYEPDNPGTACPPYGDGAEDYSSPYERFGGNFDDTYEGGYDDGANDTAVAVWEILFKDQS